jgi:AGCS family alanine or glycine:cation symporter
MSPLKIINTYLFGPALPIIMFTVGIYFMFRLKFFHISHAPKVIRALFKKRPTEDGEKSISPFKAVTVALAGTLGVGNIAGVATAITAGGAGAIFWMWLSATTSMLIKYSEIVLAVAYRRKKQGSSYYGGAVYYIRDGLGKPRIAILFAVLCIITSFTLGNTVQVKAASEALYSVFGIPPLACGIACAVLAFIVMAGGVKWISDLTVRLIPFLAIVYIVFSMVIIIKNVDMLPGIIGQIISKAFDFNAAAGGIAGFMLSRAMRFGVARGILSNEAGCGTAPTAHASANTNSPAEQGCFGIFEVFADTILLCSMTAFVILIYGDTNGLDGVILALASYENGLGSIAGYFLCGSIFLFAFATIICWFYYGSEAIGFLSEKPIYKHLYLLLYTVVIVIGSIISNSTIWELADATVAMMTVINTVCVCGMSKIVVDYTKKFISAPL